MNVQEQLTKLKDAKSLDLSGVHDEIVHIMESTNEKTSALKASAAVKAKAGFGTADDQKLARQLEEDAVNKIRGLVFGSFISLHGKPRPAAADLFFSLDGDWK